MWSFLLISLAVAKDTVSQDSSEVQYQAELQRDLKCIKKVQGCYNTYPEAQITGDGEFPVEEELDTACPNLVKMGDCFEEITEECGYQFGDPFYDRNAKFYKEICNKNSELRGKYLSNVDCYKRIENASIPNSCYNEGDKIYNQYVQSKYALKPKDYYHDLCLRKVYAHGCEAAEVQRQCGDGAAETFIQVETLKQSTTWLKHCLYKLEYKDEIYANYLPSVRIAENIRTQIKKFLDVQ